VFHSGRPNPTTREELLDFIEAASYHEEYRAPGRPRFQSIEIAVNEGTSKPFVASVLTELVQNSIDAMRGSGITGSIDINLTEEHLSVRDYVGIPDRALLALWIPFLSSKDVGELMSTGEMGTGFFNVYRQPYTKCVYITTNGLRIKAKPIVVSGRVMDIEYSVRTIDKSSTFTGTEIRIILHPMELAKFVSLKVDAGLFIYSMLSYINYTVNYNGVSVKAESELVYTSSALTIRKMMSARTPSVLMSHGVPLSLFLPYLTSLYGQVDNHDLSTGIIVDIDKRFYRPVQSRTRIITTSDEELKVELELGLHAYVTSRILESDARPLYMEAYMPLILTSVPMNNCHPYGLHVSTAKALIHHKKYVEYPVGKSQASLINIIGGIVVPFIDDYGVKITPETIAAKFARLNQPNPLDRLNDDVRNLILLWLHTKLGFKQPGGGQMTLGPIPEGLRAVDVMPKIIETHPTIAVMNKFVTVFCDRIRKLGFNLSNEVPEVVLSPMGDTRLDYRTNRGSIDLDAENKDDKVIVINPAFYLKKMQLLEREWTRFVSEYQEDKMAAAAYLRIGCEALKLFMGNTRPGPSILVRHLIASLLLTENQKAKSGHFLITFESKQHEFNFDDLCHFIYTQVALDGLWDDVVY